MPESTQWALGVLDFADLDSRALARRCERLGYARYWIAEHHGHSCLQCNSLLMSMAVASATESIRVGPAGVLLPFHTAPQVATATQLLETFFPNRIDLGLATGWAREPILSALLDGRSPNPDPGAYEKKVASLLSFLEEPPAAGGTAGRRSHSVWVLGASEARAGLAASFGLSYCLSLIHKPEPPPRSIAARYRDAFRRHPARGDARFSILVAGMCAEDEETARRLRATHANPLVRPNVVGNPEQCREAILALKERYEADEVVFLDLCPSMETRLCSLELLAARILRPPSATP